MIKREKKVDNGLVSGALALTVSVFTVKIIGYLYKLPLSHILGDEGMGYFNSAYSVFSFFYMLSLGGVPRAVAICVADAKYKYGMKSARRILNISLKIFLSIGISFAILLMTCSGFFSEIIGNNSAKLSLFCIAPSLTFVAAAGVLRGYLNGVGKLNEVAVAEILDGVSKFVTGLVLALYAAYKGFSVYIISAYTVLGVSIGAFVGALFMYICTKSKKTNEKIGQNEDFLKSKLDVLKKIFKIAAPITLSSAIMGATNIIDLGMIMRRLKSVGFSEIEAVALYGNFTTLVIPLLNLISAFVTPFATASMPYITKYKALQREDEYYKLVEQIIFLTTAAMCPMMLAYFFFAEDILLILFSDSSAITAAPLLAIAAPSVLFSALLIMSNSVLESSGYARVPLVAMSIGAVVKILSAYSFIGRFGIHGAPISTALCYLTACVISLTALRRKKMLRSSLVGITIVPLILSFVILSIGNAFYIFYLKDIGSTLIFIAFAIAVALFYIGFLLIFQRKKLIFLTDYVKMAKK